ncbi:creatininase family protein [Paenibacillus sp. J5C_2022]|uniref:creatininase family protein n=1 Tax=Paenibacillus sp. J5C2022 TaxID=2977129 RepID=UPI0021D33628|nr:creatininase family protein [Paenibacillus sp. J5C2022]MCU6711591.1 creatininase family protein [Paenibacillus sp. J5C2022]
MKRLWMGDYTREEVTELANRGCAAVVPLAATEQHGPHLPVTTDSLICRHIVKEASLRASERADLIIAPLLTIGCSQHHLAFGGTVSLTSSTYLQVLRDIGESLIRDGFRRIIFLNGHGGNEHMMHQAANDLAVAHDVWTASASYWQAARRALDDSGARAYGIAPGHAGDFETCAVLALQPELVRSDRIPQLHESREWIHTTPSGTFIGKHMELTGADGYTDAASLASAERGKAYLDAIVGEVSDWLVNTVQTMKKGAG